MVLLPAIALLLMAAPTARQRFDGLEPRWTAFRTLQLPTLARELKPAVRDALQAGGEAVKKRAPAVGQAITDGVSSDRRTEYARLQGVYEAKYQLFVELTDAYRVLAAEARTTDPAVAVAALTRVGELTEDFFENARRLPAPIEVAALGAAARRRYLGTMSEEDSLSDDRGREYFQAAADLAATHAVAGPFAERARAWLAAHPKPR